MQDSVFMNQILRPLEDAASWRTALGVSPSFATGTAQLFVQTAAPTGWTKLTSNNDKALRVVSGTAGTGGNVAFSTVFAQTATGNYTLTTPDIPSHTHNTTIQGAGGGAVAGTYVAAAGDGVGVLTAGAGGGGAHAHAMDIRVQYVDVIIATKD